MIAAAEDALERLGFSGCRARCLDGGLASVEVSPIHLRRLNRMEEKVRSLLLDIGFADVAINPLGYRKGAMNAPREKGERYEEASLV